MKFLADMNVSMSTVQELRKHGHDAVHLREEGLLRLPDPSILDKARGEDRIVLTFDLDFCDLMATGLHPLPSVVVFRLRDRTPAFAAHRLLEVIQMKEQELIQGAIIMVEDTRCRLRRLPLPDQEMKDSETDID